MVIASCLLCRGLPAPRVMAKDDKPMKLNPMETTFVQKAATAGMAEVRSAHLADDDLPIVEGEDLELVGRP